MLVALLAPLGARAQAPGNGPPPARADTTLSAPRFFREDPIGTLLENRDSLRLSDSVRMALVRLNLRLYRRNRAVELSLDSLLPRPGDRRAAARASLPPEARERVTRLTAQRRAQTAAARDTAWALLTEEQRAVADRLLERERARPGPGGGARPGGPRRHRTLPGEQVGLAERS